MKNIVLYLKERLSPSFDLEGIDLDKFHEELVSLFGETQKEYAKRRHRELQNEGFRNESIYKMISNEMKEHLFRGEALSERQIKRIIYGEK